ncbi:DUF7601 domain-containing protein [Faecalibaculum rodentium]|uniref:DUF7601 domain-containing protein n=1 Tax=Faecalibaculum rodentium TaxID=1702221 RepID=UPI0023EFD8BC|nr:hypothetical protein [Faecalibaculum rodentium]
MKHYGKLTAAAAAGFMTLSAMGVAPVFAAADGNDFTVPVTKTVTKTDSNALVPSVSFEYEVQAGTASGSVLAGVSNGLVFADNDNILEANDDAIGKETATYSGATLRANASAYTNAGVYHYVVKETTTYTDDHDGLGEKPVDLDVYVYVENVKGTLKVSAISASYVTTEGQQKTNVDFPNTYTTYTLAVTKNVTGNMGEKQRDFNFTGSVTAKGTHDRFTAAKGSATPTLVENLNTTLKDTDTYTVHGLSAKDVASIAENDYSGDGYITTIKKGTGDAATDATAVEKTATDSKNLAYTVINDKNNATPTGILMSAAPYAGLVGLGGIFAGLFFRRKRED